MVLTSRTGTSTGTGRGPGVSGVDQRSGESSCRIVVMRTAGSSDPADIEIRYRLFPWNRQDVAVDQDTTDYGGRPVDRHRLRALPPQGRLSELRGDRVGNKNSCRQILCKTLSAPSVRAICPNLRSFLEHSHHCIFIFLLLLGLFRLPLRLIGFQSIGL